MWVLTLSLDFGIVLLFVPFLSPLHFELVALQSPEAIRRRSSGSQYQQASSGKAHVFGREAVV
ncbi:hypothetical protein EJB05_23267, partial [Eragrostis curvula]